MEILHLQEGANAQSLDTLPALPDTGVVWIDIHRGSSEPWPELVQQLTGFEIHERHIHDAANETHPSFADSTDDYELLVFQSLAPLEGDDSFVTRATAFFLFERLLVTVSPANSRSIHAVKKRLLGGKSKLFQQPAGIMHLVLNNMVDRFLSMREDLIHRLGRYRQALLDPQNPFDDWQALLAYQKHIFSLEMISEGQADAISIWKGNTDFEVDDQLAVRLADLLNHIHRVSEFSLNQQREIDSLIQLHYSAVAHRTNEIVRVLTLISAIFLPLTLIAGIYGMNFEFMPELKTKFGYFFVLGGMAVLTIGLLIYFRIRKWF